MNRRKRGWTYPGTEETLKDGLSSEGHKLFSELRLHKKNVHNEEETLKDGLTEEEHEFFHGTTDDAVNKIFKMSIMQSNLRIAELRAKQRSYNKTNLIICSVACGYILGMAVSYFLLP